MAHYGIFSLSLHLSQKKCLNGSQVETSVTLFNTLKHVEMMFDHLKLLLDIHKTIELEYHSVVALMLSICRSIASRRFFFLIGTLYLYRCVTMYITTLPVPGMHMTCAPKVSGTQRSERRMSCCSALYS